MSASTSISDTLKEAVRQSGHSYAHLERETGVKRASLARFMRGEQSLRLDGADRLAAFFGLELKPIQNTES